MLRAFKLPVWFVAALVATVALCLYSLQKRNAIEAENKSVTLAAEYETVETMGAGQGLSASQAIDLLKRQGLGGIVLSEETVGELIQRGKIEIQNTSVRVRGGPAVHVASLVFADPTEVDRVRQGLQIRLGALAGNLAVRDNAMALPPVSMSLIRSTSVGLDPEEVRTLQTAGLVIIGRFANPSGLSAQGVTQTLQWAHSLGVSVFLPVGDQVLGRRDALDATEAALRKFGMLYASPEFAKIGGDENVVMDAPDLVVRLHSAMEAELDKLTYTDAVERYGRAARERNMRILLLRPVSLAAAQPLDDFGDFFKAVGDQVQREGGMLGPPKPFRDSGVPRFWPILIALAAFPIVWFTLASFVKNRIANIVFAALLGIFALAAWVHIGAQVDALLIGVCFPLTGFLLLEQVRPKNALVGFLLVSAMSFIGGLCIASMLTGLIFTIQAEEFRGVKLSVFFPIVLVGALFLARIMDMKNTLRSPITWGTAVLGIAILGALAFMIARTGNDTGAGASQEELVFRGVLDRVLFVRPRTKEFAIGHPLLFVGIGLLGLYWRRVEKLAASGGAIFEDRRASTLASWATLSLMVGAVGQTSIVNTLSHLHIPILLSLARIGIGLVLGSIIGYVLWLIVSRFVPKEDA